MGKQAKIVKLGLGRDKDIYAAESELAKLLNDGWQIIAAGGGTGKVVWDVSGFVILEKDQ